MQIKLPSKNLLFTEFSSFLQKAGICVASPNIYRRYYCKVICANGEKWLIIELCLLIIIIIIIIIIIDI